MIKRFWNWLKENKHVFLALYLPIYLIGFFWVESYVPSDSQYWVSHTPLDDLIPFVEAFVIPYCLWFPFMILTGLYLMFYDAPAFSRYMLAIAISFTASIVFFVFFPNGQNLRPATFAHDNLFTRVIGLIYAADTNTNVLPSIHVVGSVLVVFALFDTKRLKARRFLWIKAAAILLAVLITAATVFIKQHSMLDIYAGLAVCIPLYFLIYNKRMRAWTDRVFGKAAAA